MAQAAKQSGGMGGKVAQVAGRGIRIPSGGFKRASEEVEKFLICAIDGLEKNGKTHFALTMPGPIAVLSIDIGLDGVVQKFQKQKEIYIAKYRIAMGIGTLAKPEQNDLVEIADACQKAWSSICRDYKEAIEGGARSVIADTSSELWEILRMAKFGKLTQIMPHHYGPVNAEFREFVRMADDAKVNLCLLHKLVDEWKNDSAGKGTKTGEYKRAGMKDVGFLVKVNAVAWRDEDEEKIPDAFHLTIQDSRHKPELKGFDLQGDLCTFPHLAALVLDCEPEEME